MMVENGGEDKRRESETARLSDTTADASSHPTSEGNTDFVNSDVVTLLCGLSGICSKDAFVGFMLTAQECQMSSTKHCQKVRKNGIVLGVGLFKLIS